jgi:hypothetical protein
LVTLAIQGHIHGEAHYEVIVTVAGKGAFNINLVNRGDVFPPFVFFPHGPYALPTLGFRDRVAHDFDTNHAISVQLV